MEMSIIMRLKSFVEIVFWFDYEKPHYTFNIHRSKLLYLNRVL